MSMAEGIIGMVASVIAIIGGFIFTVRYLDKRFDLWISAVVENSSFIRELSGRIATLEGTLGKNGNN